MRTIEWTSAFKRDYKRVKTTPRHKDIETLLIEIADRLADDRPLAEKHRDHGLSGNWIGHRECHLKPDLLLIYKLPDEKTLRLVRMGSHSGLFAK
jgi:mRNA interferase YafQ